MSESRGRVRLGPSPLSFATEPPTRPRGRLLVLAALLAALAGCQGAELARWFLFRDDPRFEDGQVVSVAGLNAPVEIARRADGLWRVSAGDERDAMFAVGYLQARDRMAQLDLFRHIARGELAALIGDRPFGDRSALDADRMNRFLGFRADARRLYAGASSEERQALDAFVRGVNAWLAGAPRPIEHRLLGVETVRPWTAVDSLAIYLMVMHALGGNWDREVRRLAIACAAGLDTVERVWPTAIDFDVQALPDDDLGAAEYPARPAVAPELAAELPELCRQGAADTGAKVPRGADRWDVDPSVFNLAALTRLLDDGWSASNNWVVAGALTASGKPILSNDPHLPHMNPPMVWGMDVAFAGHRVAGFTLPGLHRVVFGHNGEVAWGATTNFVDRQDLVVERARSETRDRRQVDGYEFEGEFVPFELREETFEVKGAAPVRSAVRFTRDGPLINDLEPAVARRIPLTALRVTDLGGARDLDGARAMNLAHDAAELVRGLALLDLGCSSWVFADVHGAIGFRSPCRVPLRPAWSGAFPVPGWLRRYEWSGYVAKQELPASTDPRRGWLVTANSQIVPPSRFPTTYNIDVSAPNRFLRIGDRLRASTAAGRITAEASSAIELDTVVEPWRAVRRTLGAFCAPRGEDTVSARDRALLCEWDGDARADSRAATLWTLWTNALIDRALADEVPGGARGELWRYVQSLLQFEADVQWLWRRPADDPVWDDATTPGVETRGDILERAFADAMVRGTTSFGGDRDRWAWGSVRPFVLRHPFSSGSRVLGALLDSPPFAIGGDTETVFKQQFPRSDREHMHPIVGPIVRFTVDLADPWAATYTLAGGESGWPRSPFYGNLLADWAKGRGRPLTPAPKGDDVKGRLTPAG